MPAVGVMDMLRYQKFTIGWNWAPEYGTSDNYAQFQNLYKFSPLHNRWPWPICAGAASMARLGTKPA